MNSPNHPQNTDPGTSSSAAPGKSTRAAVLYGRQVVFAGKPRTLVCDGQCAKAWGVTQRPRHVFGSDPDDFVYLADDELDAAPSNPGTYEGGHAKPDCHANSNKWCSRECERSALIEPGEQVRVLDHGKRIYNQPHKHGVANPVLVPVFSHEGKPSLTPSAESGSAPGERMH